MSLADIYLTSSVLIKNRASYADSGDAVFGSATTVRAAVRSGTGTVIDTRGQAVVAKALVIVPSGTTVSDGAVVSLDGGTTYYSVLEVRRPVNMHGQTEHIEILL